MRKYINLFLCLAVAVLLVGCGDNKTPDKLLGYGVAKEDDNGNLNIGGTSSGGGEGDAAAQLVLEGTGMSASQAETGGGFGAPIYPGNFVKGINGNVDVGGGVEISLDGAWLSFDSVTNDENELLFKFQNASKTDITGSGATEILKIADLLQNAQSNAKYMILKGEYNDGYVEDSVFITTITLADVGLDTSVEVDNIDMKVEGVTAYSGYNEVFDYTITISGISFDELEVDSEEYHESLSGGTIEIEAEGQTSGVTYTAEMEFESDGSGSGTIEGSNGYTATLAMDGTTGTATYTDAQGTHVISEPVIAF